MKEHGLIWDGRRYECAGWSGYIIECRFWLGWGKNGYANSVQVKMHDTEVERFGAGILCRHLEAMIYEVREQVYRFICMDGTLFDLSEASRRVAEANNRAYAAERRSERLAEKAQTLARIMAEIERGDES